MVQATALSGLPAAQVAAVGRSQQECPTGGKGSLASLPLGRCRGPVPTILRILFPGPRGVDVCLSRTQTKSAAPQFLFGEVAKSS